MPSAQSPSALYQAAVERGELTPDTAQSQHLPTLDKLAAAIVSDQSSQGIYLYGPVGRGKSLLMDLLFAAVPITAKRRVHFHPFMEELHSRMHTLTAPSGVDPMTHLASEIATDAKLLCFDEFFVTNIGDAMFLGRLLQALFAAGVTLCATSNWAPADLYQEGFNRGRFMPFIKVIQTHLQVLEVAGDTDYRQQQLSASSPTATDFSQLFKDWTGGQTAQPRTRPLGHLEVTLLGSANSIAWASCAALCGAALGRGEYLEFCANLRGLLLEINDPITSPDMAMRLVVLVDILYENRIPTRLNVAVAELTNLIQITDMDLAIARMTSRLAELGNSLP